MFLRVWNYLNSSKREIAYSYPLATQIPSDMCPRQYI